MTNKKKYLEYGTAGLISAGLIYFALKAPLPPLIQTPQTSQSSTPPYTNTNTATPTNANANIKATIGLARAVIIC